MIIKIEIIDISNSKVKFPSFQQGPGREDEGLKLLHKTPDLIITLNPKSNDHKVEIWVTSSTATLQIRPTSTAQQKVFTIIL